MKRASIVAHYCGAMSAGMLAFAFLYAAIMREAIVLHLFWAGIAAAAVGGVWEVTWALRELRLTLMSAVEAFTDPDEDVDVFANTKAPDAPIPRTGPRAVVSG